MASYPADFPAEALLKSVTYRVADSYKEAALSAYADIRAAGSDILRFEPDYLVSQNEIAERAGLTRAAIGNFEKGARRDGFPRPRAKISSARPLWDWVEVSEWLWQHDKLDQSEYYDAVVSRAINVYAYARRVNPSAAKDLKDWMELS